MSLTVGNVVLTPTSSSYHLANRGCDHRLLVLAGTGQDAGTGRREPARRGVVVDGDAAGGTSGGVAQGATEAAAEGESAAEHPGATGQGLRNRGR